jgi:hypothetical protein
MPGNYPEESIQHSEQGESLKSRTELINQQCFLCTIKWGNDCGNIIK